MNELIHPVTGIDRSHTSDFFTPSSFHPMIATTATVPPSPSRRLFSAENTTFSIIRRSSFVVRRSSFVVRRSFVRSFVVRRSTFVRSFVRSFVRR